VNAGEGGSTYTQFEHFTVDEIQRNMGIQIAHGLAPTARVEMKSKSQSQDELGGNDTILNAMGSNAELQCIYVLIAIQSFTRWLISQ
jgi:hypothetical protein